MVSVEFESRFDESKPWEDEDNVTSSVNITDYERDVLKQRQPNEIVIPMQKIEVEFDYPLNNPATFTFEADTDKGFTRAHLIRRVCQTYHQIYQEEEAEVGNPGHVEGMWNRKTSDGKYGIWGHDLSDLVLGVYCQEGSLFGLGVDS